MSRTLKLASPAMRGHDVEALQRAVNVRFHNAHIPRVVRIDGEYGPVTKAAVHTAVYFLGLDTHRLEAHGVVPVIQRKIINPDRRNATDRSRARKRRPWLKRYVSRLEAAHHGPNLAAAYGKKFVGIVEHPAGSNHGPHIDEWEKACGFSGAPWCGMFVNAMLRAGGFPNQPWLAYCPTIEAKAKAGTDGWRWVPIGHLKLGDLPLYGSGIAQHVGFYLGQGVTVEGNTSFDDQGSQANGGAVALRHRNLSGGGTFPLRGAARPPWTKL